ncbi:MAG: hypothetical protein VX899_13105 [Myxococcota bacterium]|nr:hypothetical protein [Myxococcota bacterium]
MAQTLHILPKATVLQALDDQITYWQPIQPELARAIRETRQEVAEMPGDWIEKVSYSETTEDGESLMEGWRYQALGSGLPG